MTPLGSKKVVLPSPEKEYIHSFFLDSGAHSLYNDKVFSKGHKDGYDFYTLKKGSDFRGYVDAYAEYVKANSIAIDFYVNVDAIFNPEISWEVQKYLENEHGLHPLPVIHYGTPLKWVEKHLDEGYEYIGLGGIGQEISRYVYFRWADSVFNLLCSNRKRLPIAKTHGFAMTAYGLLIRYPWYSVDSASWVKAAGFGNVFIPHKRNGKFVFSENPYILGMSDKSPYVTGVGRHITTMRAAERAVVKEWLEFIDVPFGSETELGVTKHYHYRVMANLRFFEHAINSLPDWPWPFHGRGTTSFGVF